MLKELVQPEERFFEPFPSERITAFIRCFGPQAEEEYFSTRNPYFVAQQLMLSLSFWPKDPEKDFLKRLQELKRCLVLTDEQIRERLSGSGSRKEAIAKAKERFSEAIGRILAWEAKLEGGNSHYSQQNQLEEIYKRGKSEVPFAEWRARYLFGLGQYYRETSTKEGIYELIGKCWTTPIPLKKTFEEQFWPKKSFFSVSEGGRKLESYRPYEKFSDSIERRVLVHSVSGMSLKLQTFLGSLGDFSSTGEVSFSRNRVFVPEPHFFLNDPQKWVLFFDPQEIAKAGLVFLIGGEAAEEKEVRILPPIDFSLCLGAVPLSLIEKLGWQEIRTFPYPNQKLILIPETFQNAGEVLQALNRP